MIHPSFVCTFLSWKIWHFSPQCSIRSPRVSKNFSTVSTWTKPIIDVLGSGGNCGDTAGNKYCGQTLNVAKEQTASIPICDCSAPFFVGIVTDNVRDENSDKTANRGDTI